MTVTFRIWVPLADHPTVYAAERAFAPPGMPGVLPNVIYPGEVVQTIDADGISRYRRIESDGCAVPVSRYNADDVGDGCVTFEEAGR